MNVLRLELSLSTVGLLLNKWYAIIILINIYIIDIIHVHAYIELGWLDGELDGWDDGDILGLEEGMSVGIDNGWVEGLHSYKNIISQYKSINGYIYIYIHIYVYSVYAYDYQLTCYLAWSSE